MPIRQEPSSRAARILVVDDDRRSASATAQWLCDLGWHASAVGRVEDALRYLPLRGPAGDGAVLIDAKDAAVVTVAALVPW
jgi:DNA-binding NtrC family response regulator